MSAACVPVAFKSDTLSFAFLILMRLFSLCRSLPRVYVINKEICMRTVCKQDEYRKGETLHKKNTITTTMLMMMMSPWA